MLRIFIFCHNYYLGRGSILAKLIFTSRYLKDAPPAKLTNYVEYIATREGVEKIDTSKRNMDATQNQHRLIRQIVRDIPETKEMLEYEDYCSRPTIGNASEFITQALEQNLNLITERENYVDYIANRPRVERIGEHGLFTDAGQPVILSQVQDEVANHKGIIWTHVISLRREDADRLGYDRGEQWQALIRSKRAMLSKQMKINSANLRWYCAFHNESHHPHCHLMVYSTKRNEGYLSKPSIEAMRSDLAHDIFRQDFANIYKQQNQIREQTKKAAADIMEELLSQIGTGVCENKVIEEKILQLSKRLQNTKGKKVYGYLKADMKKIIDEIVDELAKEERVANLYKAWCSCQNDIQNIYSNKTISFPLLVQQKQFKRIKNMVIDEALKIGSCHFSFEDETFTEPDFVPPQEAEEFIPEIESEAEMEPVEPDAEGAARNIGYILWSKEYKQARNYLYGSNGVEQDFHMAYKWLLSEAENGNALAQHDLGRMCADGLGREVDVTAANEWYQKSFLSFHEAEEQKSNPYFQYRIGKMYAAGLGTEQSYESAAVWFGTAAEQGHMYAQYSLAGLYYRGQGVDKNYERAFDLFEQSAEQGNPYAQYETAKMLEAGTGTIRNKETSITYFKRAFGRFVQMEMKSHDDKLQYRIGHMLYQGTGAEKNIDLAVRYLEASAKLGNVNAGYLQGKICLEHGIGDLALAVSQIEKSADSGNANAMYVLAKIYRDGIHAETNLGKAIQLFESSAEQKNDFAAYQLGKLYLDETEMSDIPLAVKWLSTASELGNQYARYSLAKLYQKGEVVPTDLKKAIEIYTLSAEQRNQFAAYQLGKIYLSGEEIEKDTDKAIHWLTIAAEQENPFAQYTLGKLYFYDTDVPRDKEKSLYWLTASAAQGNVYAQYLIDHINTYQDPSVLLAATRLMHKLETLFFNDYQKTAGQNTVRIDRKRRRKLQEKKNAMGHAHDDYEQQNQQIL